MSELYNQVVVSSNTRHPFIRFRSLFYRRGHYGLFKNSNPLQLFITYFITLFYICLVEYVDFILLSYTAIACLMLLCKCVNVLVDFDEY